MTENKRIDICKKAEKKKKGKKDKNKYSLGYVFDRVIDAIIQWFLGIFGL